MNKEIAKQLEFIKWLKDNKLYNEYESASTMSKMQKVWKTAKK